MSGAPKIYKSPIPKRIYSKFISIKYDPRFDCVHLAVYRRHILPPLDLFVWKPVKWGQDKTSNESSGMRPANRK